MVVIQGLSQSNEESSERQENKRASGYAGLRRLRGTKMVTAATVTTLSKKAQKARRVRKAGEESSLSSTDSESGRPVTRSQGVRKVAVPVNTRKREDKRQAAGQAVVQAESKPVKIKRRASANQQRSTSKNKDVKELGRVIATDEKDCTRRDRKSVV